MGDENSSDDEDDDEEEGSDEDDMDYVVDAIDSDEEGGDGPRITEITSDEEEINGSAKRKRNAAKAGNKAKRAKAVSAIVRREPSRVCVWFGMT
jgi:hypothetical protein